MKPLEINFIGVEIKLMDRRTENGAIIFSSLNKWVKTFLSTVHHSNKTSFDLCSETRGRIAEVSIKIYWFWFVTYTQLWWNMTHAKNKLESTCDRFYWCSKLTWIADTSVRYFEAKMKVLSFRGDAHKCDGTNKMSAFLKSGTRIINILVSIS
jgi:hypothetical protein